MPDGSSRRSRLLRRRPGVHGALTVALVLVLSGYLFAANARLAGPGGSRHGHDLHGIVQAELDRAEALADEVAELRTEVEELTDSQTDGVPVAATEEAELVRLAAGRVALTGPGVTVRLTDAPANAPRPDWVVNDHLVVHQQDLQAVINALWAGGAEAMALQDQRVISTSAFRCVGNVLLLHGRHYSPPYVVRAIGDPEALRTALLSSPEIQNYLDYVDAVGLGWQLTTEAELELPAYDGGLELHHATVPDGVDVSTAAP